MLKKLDECNEIARHKTQPEVIETSNSGCFFCQWQTQADQECKAVLSYCSLGAWDGHRGDVFCFHCHAFIATSTLWFPREP